MGNNSNKIRDKKYIQKTQPKVTIINPAIGAKINCPKDEPAFIKPKAIPTFSCGISLFTEASTTGRPAIPSPIDAITPKDIDKVNAVVEKGISRVPKRMSKIPIIKVFPEPYLSAIIPPKGDIAPINSWPRAKAKLICR